MKAKAHIFFIAIMFFLCLHNVTAQKELLKGFIVTNHGDTIFGEFFYHYHLKTPDSLVFNPDIEKPSLIISPKNVHEFTIGRYRYVSGNVNREDLPYDHFIELNKTLPLKVFLLALFEGDKNLYAYYDQNKQVYLFILDSGKYEKLQYRDLAEDSPDENLHPAPKNWYKDVRYKGQLILYLKECQEIGKSMTSLNYNAKAISGIYSAYYKCIDKEPSYKHISEKAVARFGFMGGLTLTNLKLDGVGDLSFNWAGVAYADYEKSIKPAYGAFCEVFNPNKMNRWSLVTELVYTSFETEGHYIYPEDPDYGTVYEWYYKYKTNVRNAFLGVHVLGRYLRQAGKIGLFANAGLRMNFELSGENTLNCETNVYGAVTDLPTEKAFESKGTEEGVLLGFGARYGKFSLEARYSTGFSYVTYHHFSANINQFSFLLGVRLK